MNSDQIFKDFSMAAIVAIGVRCNVIELVRKAAGDVYSLDAQRAVLDQVYPGLGSMDLDKVVELGNTFKRELNLPNSVYDEKDEEEVRAGLLAHSKPTPGLVHIKGQAFVITPNLSVDHDGDTPNFI